MVFFEFHILAALAPTQKHDRYEVSKRKTSTPESTSVTTSSLAIRKLCCNNSVE